MKYEIEIPNSVIPDGYEPVGVSAYNGWFYESKESRSGDADSRLLKLTLRKKFDYGLLWDQLASFKAGIYFATDSDGRVFSFVYKPKIKKEVDCWVSEPFSRNDWHEIRPDTFHADFPPLDWDKSLIRKPVERDGSWFDFEETKGCKQ